MSAVDFAFFVDELASRSGAAILPFFRTSLSALDKAQGGVFDPVTEADKASEAVMRQLITRTFPEHGIVGEEYGSEREDAEFVWVLDPIDGTRAFIAGREDWSISAALVENGRPTVAAVFAPVTEEMFVATVGNGATRNDVAMTATSGSELAGAKLGGPKRIVDWLTQRHPNLVAMPRIHSLALRIVRVATGELDAAIAGGSGHDWDLAAADLLVHEAGGAITGLDGKPLIYNKPEPVHSMLVAAGKNRHSLLVDCVKQAT